MKFSQVFNIGIRSPYQNWERNLTRKLNAIALFSIANLIFGLFVLNLLGIKELNLIAGFAILSLPVVLILNHFKNYIWAVYWYYCTDFVFISLFCLKLGFDSYAILYFFPMIVSMMQLLGRKATLSHMIILSVLCLLSVSGTSIGLLMNDCVIHIDASIKPELILLNIFLSFFSTITLTILLIMDYLREEKKNTDALKEKEILLAEVFHRVKNNLNIVTSLLNLKKNASTSIEVIEALEVCRNRVFSMALVHQNVFNKPTIIGVNFKNYIENLVKEIGNSIFDEDETLITLDSENIDLELSNAIPCGLILNELITNSFKYAKQPNQLLKIHVSLKDLGDTILLEVRDNGPGIPEEILVNLPTLGIELIRSLSDQLNGSHTFSNDNGLVFRLNFKKENLSSQSIF